MHPGMQARQGISRCQGKEHKGSHSTRDAVVAFLDKLLPLKKLEAQPPVGQNLGAHHRIDQ